MSKRVHFWTADQGGSAYYRGHLPALGLSWLGHRPSVGIVLPNPVHGHDSPDDLDVIIGCRVSNPRAVMQWKRFKDQGKRIILDLDDDYFHVDPTNEPGYTEWQDPDRQAGLITAIHLSDTVTVCSDRLKTVLDQYHDDVRVIRNGLPAQFLADQRNYDPDELTVGWAGSSSTAHELPLAARHLNRISEYKGSLTPISVHAVGLEPQDAMKFGLKGERVYATGFFAETMEYLQAVNVFDIWVAPYRDTPFNNAKFATKALEAGFLGIPLIVSAIEPYAQDVIHEDTGFLVPVGQEHLFGKYLKMLVDDAALRQEIGLNARAKASGSIMQHLNKQWEAVING